MIRYVSCLNLDFSPVVCFFNGVQEGSAVYLIRGLRDDYSRFFKVGIYLIPRGYINKVN